MKIVRDFIWEENITSRIALDYLHQKTEEGGLNLLDLKARNKAIEIMWLKTYLNMSPTRPPWAKITDLLLDAVAPQGYNAQAWLNTFLQTWNVPTRGAWAEQLLNNTLRMMKTAQEHKANFATLRLSLELRKKLPAWFQNEAEHRPTNNKATQYLLKKHKIVMMADIVKTAARIWDNTQELNHRPTNYCNCQACAEDQRKQCTHLYDCTTEVLAGINATTPKANPLHQGYRHDNLSLTRRRKDQNRKAIEKNRTITFNPTITSKNDITKCFRIFADTQKMLKHPAQRLIDERTSIRHDTTRVYTDGACTDNGKENAWYGGGIWFEPNDPRNLAFRVPGEWQSNQIGELAATIMAIKRTPHFCPLEIQWVKNCPNVWLFWKDWTRTNRKN